MSKMRCPYCNAPDTKVSDSRSDDNNCSIKRRRYCPTCGRKFTTFEIVERPTIYVVKKDGRREPFKIDKMRQGLLKACEKRPVTIEQIDDIIIRVKESVETSMEKEITSTALGEYAMGELKKLDDIAYVRFASVYRQFRDINNFIEEINDYMGR